MGFGRFLCSKSHVTRKRWRQCGSPFCGASRFGERSAVRDGSSTLHDELVTE